MPESGNPDSNGFANSRTSPLSPSKKQSISDMSEGHPPVPQRAKKGKNTGVTPDWNNTAKPSNDVSDLVKRTIPSGNPVAQGGLSAALKGNQDRFDRVTTPSRTLLDTSSVPSFNSAAFNAEGDLARVEQGQNTFASHGTDGNRVRSDPQSWTATLDQKPAQGEPTPSVMAQPKKAATITPSKAASSTAWMLNGDHREDGALVPVAGNTNGHPARQELEQHSTHDDSSDHGSADEDAVDLTGSVQNQQYMCYDIEVVGGVGYDQDLNSREKKEIGKAFRKKVGMDATTVDATDIVHVNSSTVLAADSIEQWQGIYLVTIGTTEEKPRVLAGTDDASLHKIYTASVGGRTRKKWMQIVWLDHIIDPEVLVALNRTEHGSNMALDEQGIIKELYRQRKRSYIPSKFAKLAMVFAKRSTITIEKLLTMACWAGPRERSLVQQLESRWAAGEVRKKAMNGDSDGDRLVLENRILNKPTPLSCGLEHRSGSKAKFLLTEAMAANVEQTHCEQYFFQSIQVSDFLNAFFGPGTINCTNKAQIARLTKMLSGVNVVTGDKMRTKPRAIQAIVDQTAEQIKIPSPGSVPSTMSLAAKVKKLGGRPLRYPDLPCIDIGINGYPFYLPAEACRIEPNQPFKGPLPFVQCDNAFKLQPRSIPRVDTLSPTQLQSNPFKDADVRAMDIIFAEVIVLGRYSTFDEASADHRVGAEKWTQFQHEIGQRFGGKLEKAVKRSRSIVLRFSPTDGVAQLWARSDFGDNGGILRSSLRGTATTLIVSIPGGVHNQVIHKAVRQLCDIDLGIQCSIVTTKQIMQRCGSAEPSQSLVKYTGQIVRTCFARYLQPPAIDDKYYSSDDFANHYGKSKDIAENGVLIGIHVVPIQDIIDPADLDIEYTAEDHFMVTIASFGYGVTRRGEMFHSTHQLASTAHGLSLPQNVTTCVRKHLESLSPVGEDGEMDHSKNDLFKASSVVYYRSGYGADDRFAMSDEVELLSDITSNKQLFHHYTDTAHLTFAEQPTIKLSEESGPIAKDEVNCLVRLKRGSHVSSGENQMELYSLEKGRVLLPIGGGTMQDNMTNPFGLSHALHSIFVRNSSDVTAGRKTYQVTYCHEITDPSFINDLVWDDFGKDAVQRLGHKVSAFDYKFPKGYQPNDQRIHVFHSLLKHMTIPDMVFLTQRASIRALKYVEERIGMGSDGGNLGFTMPAINEQLQHSLYFL